MSPCVALSQQGRECSRPKAKRRNSGVLRTEKDCVKKRYRIYFSTNQNHAKALLQAAFSAVCIRRNSGLSARSKVKQDKGCMPPKGGICHFTPTGNAVREVQCVLPFGVCVKTGIPICRNKPILKRNAGIQKVFRKGKCYE